MTAIKPTQFENALIKALPDGKTKERLTQSGLPHRRVEDWKWSDLRSVATRMAPATQGFPLEASLKGTQGQDTDSSGNLMTDLAAELGDVHHFTLKDGESLDLSVTNSGHGLIVIDVPDGCSAKIRESFQLEEGAFTNASVIIEMGKGASLERVIIQDGDDSSVFILTSRIHLSAGASLSQTTLGFGGKLVRMETQIEHPGNEAKVDLNCAYLLSEGRHFDQTSIVRHTGEGCITRQLCKGAAANKATGVFQGKFHVEREAQKTDADMQHRGLLLSDGATINAKPELEIYADDVVCAHGNAIGAIDEDALFYMRQRGLDETSARTQLTASFLAEPLDAIRDETLRDTLLETLNTRLESLG